MEPFIGEIRAVGFNFAPQGWALCQGQLMPIAQNTALFALLGVFYGGDGRTTFALPDLRGRVPVHSGSSAGPGRQQWALGQQGGAATHTLNTAEMPAHTHGVPAVDDLANSNDPTSGYPAQGLYISGGDEAFFAMYSAAAPNTPMGSAQPAGGNQPHANEMPYQVMNYIIALSGTFPTRA